MGEVPCVRGWTRAADPEPGPPFLGRGCVSNAAVDAIAASDRGQNRVLGGLDQFSGVGFGEPCHATLGREDRLADPLSRATVFPPSCSTRRNASGVLYVRRTERQIADVA